VHATIIARLAQRWAAEPERVVCRLLNAAGEAQVITARQLRARVRAWAAAFGRVDGARKLIGVSLYSGLDLHAAFFGALWAGHLPTMIAPPSPRMEPQKYAQALAGMVAHLQLDGWVAAGDWAPAGVEVLRPEQVAADTDFAPELGAPEDLALVQHSSGTTGLQKGVALSHRAVLAHNARYRAALALTEDDVIVSWLPLYHDMGFVACFLLPYLEGVTLVELSPFDWVRRPLSLLEALSRHGGTLCWLPNFAYNFMVKALRDPSALDALDLGGVRAFINCSEPVQAASHAAFVRAFAPAGVRAEQLAASYAMAENVFAVTQTAPGAATEICCDAEVFARAHRVEPAAEGLRFVCNGPALPGTEVRVCGASGPLPDGHVGELQLRGSHLFSGYFRRADLSAAATTADGWYRTGDLGFVLEGGIYVTGRLKDLVIVQGKNLYPTDAERAAGAVPGVNPGRVVAFGLPDPRLGTEQLAILVETAADFTGHAGRLSLAIRNHVAQTLDITPGVVKIVPARWLVKSTSGKLARGDNRAKYLRERAHV
jgi:fatty-acyl-CoA synthase